MRAVASDTSALTFTDPSSSASDRARGKALVRPSQGPSRRRRRRHQTTPAYRPTVCSGRPAPHELDRERCELSGYRKPASLLSISERAKERFHAANATDGVFTFRPTQADRTEIWRSAPVAPLGRSRSPSDALPVPVIGAAYLARCRTDRASMLVYVSGPVPRTPRFGSTSIPPADSGARLLRRSAYPRARSPLIRPGAGHRTRAVGARVATRRSRYDTRTDERAQRDGAIVRAATADVGPAVEATPTPGCRRGGSTMTWVWESFVLKHGHHASAARSRSRSMRA